MVKLTFERAMDVQEMMFDIVDKLGLTHIDPDRVVCMRSQGSTSRAIARIWAMPRIWQHALDIEAAYVLEVISKYYDKQPQDEREKTIIHELMHVPKTFSGALVPHKCFGKVIGHKSVGKLHKEYRKASQSKQTKLWFGSDDGVMFMR